MLFRSEYFKIGTGPFNDFAKVEILTKLLEAEKEYNKKLSNYCKLITDDEIIEIKKLWLKQSLDINLIDQLLQSIGRDPVKLIMDTFETMNQKYEKQLSSILKNKNLEMDVLVELIQQEKKCITNNKRDEMQKFIRNLFESDKINYQ